MSINHDIFLNKAKSILSKPTQSELDYRMSAGRAYYFIFHHVKKYLKISPSTRVTSHFLILQLQKSTNINDKAAATEMKNCRRIRVDADYFINKHFSNFLARQAIQHAENIKIFLP